jgi:hypothetical protein
MKQMRKWVYVLFVVASVLSGVIGYFVRGVQPTPVAPTAYVASSPAPTQPKGPVAPIVPTAPTQAAPADDPMVLWRHQYEMKVTIPQVWGLSLVVALAAGYIIRGFVKK